MTWLIVCGTSGVLAITFATTVRGIFKFALLAAGAALLPPLIAHDEAILLSLTARRGE
jgi:hypothetical protein